DVAGYPAPLVTHHLSGPALGYPGAEARRRQLQLIVSLGISLPRQDLHADLLLACTAAYRS
ncbi:MAG: hypothetical protein WCC38_07355, partial [Pseudonocardiaceae bacterium]